MGVKARAVAGCTPAGTPRAAGKAGSGLNLSRGNEQTTAGTPRAAGAENPFLCFFPTSFGPMAIVWSLHAGKPGILQVVLSRPSITAGCIARGASPGMVESSCPEVDGVVEGIRACLAGENVPLSLDAVRMDLLGGFQQRVLRAEHAVPRGSVSTYGRIAAHLGVPGGARAVGTALATNPFPIIVPCHRAIRSDGTLGGFQGGLHMKRALLLLEGVSFTDRGRVADTQYYY